MLQFSSVPQSCLTLCDPMNRSMPGLPVHHQLPEFTQTQVHQVSDAIRPSHPVSSQVKRPHQTSCTVSYQTFINSHISGLPRWLQWWRTCLPVKGSSVGVWPLGQEDPRRRAWQSTPVFLPGESHRQKSLAGYSPWGRKESNTTELT